MSAGSKQKGTWLSEHYDKVLVGIMAVALLGSAASLALQLPMLSRLAQPANLAAAHPRAAQPMDMAAFQAYETRFRQPFAAGQGRQSLLVSELRVVSVNPAKPWPIPFYATNCPFTGYPQPAVPDPDKQDSDNDGIPDRLEIKYGLNPSDPNDATMDDDADGFSNLEEIMDGTNPRDAKSHPALAVKLRAEEISDAPFPLMFQAMMVSSDNTQSFQVSVGGKTKFIRLGEGAGGYAAAEYIAKGPKGPALVLTNGSKRITLQKGKPLQHADVHAHLVLMIDQRRFEVRTGVKFKVGDSEYIVVDIQPDGVLIRNTSSGQDFTVRKLSERERNSLSLPKAPGA